MKFKKLLGLSILFLFLLSTSVLALDTTNNEYWGQGFDNTTGQTSISNYDVFGGISFIESSIDTSMYGAANFDGSNDYGKLPSLTYNDNSHCAWIYLDSYASSLGYGIFDFRSDKSIWDLVQETGDVEQHKLRITVQDGSTKGLHSNNVIPLNTWTHYCSVIDNGNSMSLYINGAFENSISIGTVATQSSGDNTFGSAYYGSTYSPDFLLDGRMDDIRVYDTVLTSDDVSNIYNNGNGNQADVGTPLVHLTLDSLYDFSGNSVEPQAYGGLTLGNEMDFDGIDDYVNLGNPYEINTGDFTIPVWIKTSNTPSGVFHIINNGGIGYFSNTFNVQMLSDGKIKASCNDGTSHDITSSASFNDGTEHLILIKRSSGTFELKIDDGSEGTITCSGDVSDSRDFNIGWLGGSNGYIGNIYSSSVWSVATTSEQDTEIYEGGPYYNPYTAVEPVTNFDVFELATGFSRDDTQSITSTEYQTFMNGVFNLDNASAVAFNIIFNLEAGVDDPFTCRAIIDDTYESEINITTQTASEITSNYLITTAPTLSVGIHDFEFQCKKLGGSNGQISLLSGILEQSTDVTGVDINFERVSNTSTIDSGTLTNILETDYTVLGYNQTQNQTTLTLDGFAQIDFKGTERQVELQYFLDDVYLESTIRDGSTTGSLAVFTGLNATVGDTINLKVKARINSGTLSDVDITSSVVIKEFVFLDYANQFNTSIGTPITVTTSDTEIYTYDFTGDSSSNYILKFVGNVYGDTNNQDLDCTIKFNDDVLSSFTSQRSLKTLNKYKVINNQYILENATTGSNNVSVSCVVDTGNVELDPAVLFHATDKGSLNYTSMDFYAYDRVSSNDIDVFNVSITGFKSEDINSVNLYDSDVYDWNYTTYDNYINFGNVAYDYNSELEYRLYMVTDTENISIPLTEPCLTYAGTINELKIQTEPSSTLTCYSAIGTIDFLYTFSTIPTKVYEMQIVTTDLEDVNIQTTDGNATYYYSSKINLINYTYESLDYFDESTDNYLVNGDVNQSMLFKRFNVTAKDITNASTINDFSIDYYGTIYDTTTGYIELVATQEIETFDVYSDVYRSKTYVHNISADLEAELNSSFVTFEFLDAGNSTPLNGSDVEVVFNGLVTQDYVTDSNGEITFNSIISGVEYDDYVITFKGKQGYVTPITFERSSLAYPYSETIQISTAKIEINIYDRISQTLLTGVDVNVFIQGFLNETTSNGTLVIEDLTLIEQTFTIVAASEGYFTEEQTFDFTNQENIQIDFYLLNLTAPDVASIYVSTLDEFYNTQPDTKTELLEYDVATQSFIEVSECLTNSNGECQFLIELNTKKYIITGEKTIDGQLFTDQTSTVGEFIRSEDEVRQLFLKTGERYSSNKYTALDYTITESFNNNVSSVDVTFSTTDGTVTTLCVEYFIVEDFDRTSDGVTCEDSATGIIDVDKTLNRSNMYQVQVYQIDNLLTASNKYILYKKNYNKEQSFEEVLTLDELLSPIVLLPYLLLLTFALYTKKLNIFNIGSIFATWFLFAFFPSIMLGIVAGLLTIMGIWLFILSSKKEDVQ